MRETTAAEHQAQRNRPGVVVRYMFGKRYNTTEVSLCGRRIAEKTDVLTRGKVVSTIYLVTL
jgi:hypothetical protein